jgi:calcineurin-like phosphoesterase family protein
MERPRIPGIWQGPIYRVVVRGFLSLVLIACAVASAPAQTHTAKRPQTPSSGDSKAPGLAPPQPVVLVGAGDIAACKHLSGAQATAKLLDQIPGTVFALGDLAYDKGSASEFQNCYGITWGRFKSRTRPALGNHEYGQSSTAAAYFDYWGEAAGPVGKGYYSYELGAWHIVVLNTNCGAAGLGGCGEGSPQETWLKADLAEHPDACILAYGHHALFSSGIFRRHAVHPELKPLWRDLYAAHADLALAGHEHSYERFAPQDPEGHADAQGILEIVAGTGGRSHELLGIPLANSQVRDWTSYGVLKLTLAPGQYTWEFIPVEGGAFRDSGSGVCHNRRP